MAMGYLTVHTYLTEHSDILLGRVHMTTWPSWYSCCFCRCRYRITDMAAAIAGK
jgi:hypothetical protein